DDVRDRGEGDTARHRDGGESRHEGDDLRGGPGPLVPGEAAEQGHAQEEKCHGLPAHPARPCARGSAAVPESTRDPCSTVMAAPSRIRATSVEKYQPPDSSSSAGPSATTSPLPRSTTRSAKVAANST